MATDVEEFDTDEKDRSAVPPKRRRTGLVGAYRNCDPTETDRETEEAPADESEILARKTLRVWQNCQVAKGFLDNALNREVERSILDPCRMAESDDDDDDIEDTAVRAAIVDRGLVRAALVDFVRDLHSPEPSSPRTMLLPPSLSSIPVHPMPSRMEDPIDDNNCEQDFLECAVAEAIKKKGLSALSVDYG